MRNRDWPLLKCMLTSTDHTRPFVACHAYHDTDVIEFTTITKRIWASVQERIELLLVICIRDWSPRTTTELHRHPYVGVHDLLSTSLSQTLNHFERIKVVASQFARERPSELERSIFFGKVGPFAQVRAAHEYSSMKIGSRALRQYVHSHTCRARFVSNQRYIRSIAVEILDIFVDKLHGHSLIVKAEISWSALAFSAQESEGSEAIIDSYYYKTSLG